MHIVSSDVCMSGIIYMCVLIMLFWCEFCVVTSLGSGVKDFGSLKNWKMEFLLKTFEVGAFWPRRSNAPEGRSNAKARGETWPLAIRTPLSGVRTPRLKPGGVRTPLPGVRTPGLFLDCFAFFTSILLVSSFLPFMQHTWNM